MGEDVVDEEDILLSVGSAQAARRPDKVARLSDKAAKGCNLS